MRPPAGNHAVRGGCKVFLRGALIYHHHRAASGMAAHAGVARLMYVMGRDGVFEKLRLRSSEMARTPAMNIIPSGAIALLAINFDLVMATALINFARWSRLPLLTCR